MNTTIGDGTVEDFASPYRLQADTWAELVRSLGVGPKPVRARPAPQARFSAQEPGGHANDNGAEPSYVWKTALKRAGRLGRHLGAGKFAVLCVNDAEHSTPDEDAERAAGSCVLHPPGEGQSLGYPQCSHAHCAGLTLRDWINGIGHDVWRSALLEVRGWRATDKWLMTEDGITGWLEVPWPVPGEPSNASDGPTQYLPDPAKRLAHFFARITADEEEHFEPGRSRHLYEIDTCVMDVRKMILVPSGEFSSGAWIHKELGADAVVAAGRGKADEFREAVQLLSRPVPRRHVFGYTGFEKVGARWVYLHAGGAIGADGVPADVRVRVSRNELKRFAFPEIPSDPRVVARAIRAAFDLFRLGDPAVMIPLLAATWRAPLGPSATTLFLAGQQESGKSQYAAFAQQHFGAGMHRRALPAKVPNGTAKGCNALRAVVGDALFVYDDYLRTGDARRDAEFNAKVEEVIRAQESGSGRLALQTDGALAAEGVPPRSLLVITGEASHALQSAVSRTLTLDVVRHQDDIRPAIERAARGDYALAMAAFIRWLCPQYDAVRAELPEVIESTSARLAQGGDERTTGMIGDCAAGLRKFLEFAVPATEVLGRAGGAIEREDADRLRADAWTVFQALRTNQRGKVSDLDPYRLLVRYVGSGIAMGDCYVTTPDGLAPQEPQRWGWRPRGSRVVSIARPPDNDGVCAEPDPDFAPSGKCLGEVDAAEGVVYARAEALLAVAKDVARKTGESLPIDGAQLGRGLNDRGFLARTEWKSRKTWTVRRDGRGGWYALKAEALQSADTLALSGGDARQGEVA